jgi:hypothetical protein
LCDNRARLVVLALGIASAVGARLVLGDVPGRTDLRMDGLLPGCAIAIAPVLLPRWLASVGGLAIGLTILTTNDLSIGMPIVAAATALIILSRMAAWTARGASGWTRQYQ